METISATQSHIMYPSLDFSPFQSVFRQSQSCMSLATASVEALHLLMAPRLHVSDLMDWEKVPEDVIGFIRLGEWFSYCYMILRLSGAAS